MAEEVFGMRHDVLIQRGGRGDYDRQRGVPLMATYYATKSYVYNLTMAIYEELRRKKSNVKINVLCPGPSKTKFFERAKC